MTNNIWHFILIFCLYCSLPDLGIAQEFSTTSDNTQLEENMRLGWNKSIRVRGLMQEFDPFNDVKITSLNDSLEKFRDLAERIDSQDEPDQAILDKIRSITPSLSDRSFIKSETIATTFWVKLRDKLEKQLKSENNTLKVYKVTNSSESSSTGQPVYTAGEATTEYDIALQWLNDGLDVVKEKGVERIVGNNQGLGGAGRANDAVMIRNLESIVALAGNAFAQNADVSVENFSDLSMFEVEFEVNIDEEGFSFQPTLIIFGMTFYRTQQDVPNYNSVQIKEHYNEYTLSAIHALDKRVGLVLDLEDPKTLEFLVTQGIEIGGQKVNKSFYNLIKNLHYEYDIRSENEMVVQEASRFGYEDINKFKKNMRDNYNAIFLEQLYGKAPTWWVNNNKGIITNGLFKIDLQEQDDVN